MTIDELTRLIDDLSWEEHVEFEIDAEDPPAVVDRSVSEVDARLRALAIRLSPGLLDALERRPGYVGWALRLAPHVPGGRARTRAERHARDPDSDVRYWSERILERVS